MSLHPDVVRLSEALKMMIAMLSRYGNKPWADELEYCRAIIDQSNFYGVERLLKLYGGMGSLNDLILQHQDTADSSENDAFDRLRNEVRIQAAALARDEPFTNIS